MDQVFTPPCPNDKSCGGCQLQRLSYPEQLRRKQGRVISLLVSSDMWRRSSA